MVEHLQHRTSRTRLWITGAIHEARESRVHHGAGTHGAGLDGDEHLATHQPVIAKSSRCLAKRNDFRVAGRVVIEQVAIVGGGQNPAILDYQSANRHLAGFGALSGLFQGQLHPGRVTARACRERVFRSVVHLSQFEQQSRILHEQQLCIISVARPTP